MNDRDLIKQLNSLPVPEPDANPRERAKYRALVAFKSQNANAPAPKNSRWQTLPRFCAKTALVAGVIVATVIIFKPRQDDASGKVLAQISQFFPGRLNAVIERDGVAEIDLADRADPALITDQPLLVSLERRGEKINILSFSGRVVRLRLDGREVSFEMLLTADGQVIVSGDDFFRSNEHRARMLGYRLRAQALTAKL